MKENKIQDQGSNQPQSPKDDIEFDWSDILAFIIATIQVLSPYILFIFGGIMIVMILLQLFFL